MFANPKEGPMATFRFRRRDAREITEVKGRHGKKYAFARAIVQFGLRAGQIDLVERAGQDGHVKPPHRPGNSRKRFAKAQDRVQEQVGRRLTESHPSEDSYSIW